MLVFLVETLKFVFVSLRDAFISVIKDEITEKVCLMAGQVDRNLTGDVTHLIAGEVGSNKYLVIISNINFS